MGPLTEALNLVFWASTGPEQSLTTLGWIRFRDNSTCCVCVCARAHVCVCVCVCVCVFVFTVEYTLYIHLYLHLYVPLNLCLGAYVCVCMSLRFSLSFWGTCGGDFLTLHFFGISRLDRAALRLVHLYSKACCGVPPTML